MKRNLPEKQRQFIKLRPPKLIYNPAQQFKHRDRGIKSGKSHIK